MRPILTNNNIIRLIRLRLMLCHVLSLNKRLKKNRLNVFADPFESTMQLRPF